MPVLGGVIAGVGSLAGGLIGSAGAGSAGKTVSNAGQAINSQLNGIATTGDTNITNATAAGQGLIATGQNGVAGATAAGQQGVNGALGTAAGLYGVQAGNLNPYLNTGSQAVGALGNALAPGGSLSGQFAAPTAADLTNPNNPAYAGYQFQLQQGQQAVNRAAAATGSLGSGGTEKALDQYTQGLASTYSQQQYNNALQSYQTNFQNTYNTLAGAAGIGQNASSQLNQASQTYGNQALQGNQFNASLGLSGATTGAQLGLSSAQLGVAGTQAAAGYDLQGAEAADQAYMQGAQGFAAGQAGQANAWSGALNGAGQALGSTLNMYNGLTPAGYGYTPYSQLSPTNQGMMNTMNGYTGNAMVGTMSPAASAGLNGAVSNATGNPYLQPNYSMPMSVYGYNPPAPSASPWSAGG